MEVSASEEAVATCGPVHCSPRVPVFVPRRACFVHEGIFQRDDVVQQPGALAQGVMFVMGGGGGGGGGGGRPARGKEEDTDDHVDDIADDDSNAGVNSNSIDAYWPEVMLLTLFCP